MYALYNKKKGFIPFYVGITDNPRQRLQQHKCKKVHKQFCSNPRDIGMKILYNTGNGKGSRYLAERLEIKMIRYYNTVKHGSNQCVDIKDCLPERYVNYSERYNGKLKNKDVDRIMKLQKLLHDNPFVTGEELASFLFITKSGLDKFCKRTLNIPLTDIIQLHRKKYFEEHNT